MKIAFTRLLLFALVCALPDSGLYAQLVDNFEDGNLFNPDWIGDTDDFVVEDGRLRLRAEGSGTSVLSVDLPQANGEATLESFNLEFLVDMDFSPSGSNNCIIRFGDIPSMGNAFTGFSMMMGGISGDQDAWRVVGVEGGDLIQGEFAGEAGALGGDPAIIRFQVNYNTTDGWIFAADYTGGTNYQVQGTLGPDFSFLPNSFEVTCNYTSTRADKFSFDDLNANATYQEVVDDIPPRLIQTVLNDRLTATLSFSELVADVTAAQFTAGAGVTVESAIAQGSRVVLTFSEELPDNVQVPITVTTIQDLVGNVATDLRTSVIFRLVNPARVGNLLVTEFFPDPNPVVGLPEFEFVELFNPSDTAVDLATVMIGSGGTPVQLMGTLPAGEYVVLVDEDARAGFVDLGATVTPVDLPGLSNSSDNISLISGGDTLFSFDYTDDWYNDPERDGGGYTIEYTRLSGADAGCSGLWRASLDASGGTPGRENSVINQPADQSGPQLVSTAISVDGITLGFSEPVSNNNADIFLTLGQEEVPISSVSTEDGGRTFLISFVDELLVGSLYTLELPDLEDCVGNVSPARELTLGIPNDVTAGDIVINEILFEPASGGAEFVELYNCSDRLFQINGWTVSNTFSTSAQATRDLDVDRLFLPGTFLVLTDEPDDLTARYRNVDANAIVEFNVPSLGNGEGNVTISVGNLILDAFDYTDDLHSELLDETGGVSLERLRYKVATTNDANWFSAASVEGGATPSRANSQLRDIDTGAGGSNEVFSLVSQTFSPDLDGNEDVLEIRYQGVPVGSLARIRIFDAQGRPIRTLRNTELLGTEGSLTWDGANDDGRRAKAGAYLMLLELINPDGPVVEEKLVAVLAGDL